MRSFPHDGQESPPRYSSLHRGHSKTVSSFAPQLGQVSIELGISVSQVGQFVISSIGKEK